MFKWSKQVILLTGGTGSFGQAFTKFLLKKHPPKILRIYSRDEFKQDQMEKEIKHKCLRFFIGDVRDNERLRWGMQDVTLVIHAAAMKQIVACEYNPTEAIQTNINGTMNVLTTAINARVERVLGLITDKAVSPINLYGATKLCAEKLLIQGNYYVGNGITKISCVRYGNVAGSRGSVIPLFNQQTKNGLLTVTHKDATRFWITLEEGVEFVSKCVEKMRGREVFIPKMPSFSIMDLTSIMSPTTKVKLTGLRPGEKLHEDLITKHESHNTFEFNSYFVVRPHQIFDEQHDKKRIIGGKSVAKNFFYSSDTNPRRLTPEELKKKIRQLSF